MSSATLRRAPYTKTVVFSSGDTESSAVNISKWESLGMISSTGFDGTSVSFKVAHSSSGDYYPLYQGSSQVTVAVSTAEARAFLLDLLDPTMLPWSFLVLVSNATGGETAERTWVISQK